MRPLRDLAPYEDDPRGRMGAAAPLNTIRRMPAGNPEQTFFHFDFLRALEMHRKLAGGIFLAALVLCGAYVARRWNTYKAESLIYVQPMPSHLLDTAQSRDSWPFDANTYEPYMQEQIHNVTRADVLAAAVEKIDGFKGPNESVQAAAARLGGNLEVTRVGTGYQISIMATAGSPDEAAQMANATAESFIDSATKELRSGDAQRLALLGEERDRVQKELASDRAEQDALNKKLGVASVGGAPDFYDEQIAAVRAELVKARTDSDQAAATLMATAGGGPSSAALDAAADKIVAADPGLVSSKTALNKRRADLISQMANLTPAHPLYKQDAEELAKINTSLDAMTKDLRAKAAAEIEQTLKTDLERTSSVEARLNAQLAQLTSAAGSATPRLQRATDLATDISRLQARFTMVDEQYRNLMMENAAPGAVYLSAAAVPPLHADRKKVFRNAGIVLLIGLLFAVGGALIAYNLDPRIYIAADVERVLGFAPMALLPDLYEVGTGVAEEYMLRLAAAVEHSHQQGSLNSCIFTGVAAGAGATTISTRVSSMLQAMGRDTTLVDAVGAEPPQLAIHPGSELVHSPRGSRSTALLQQMNEEAREDTIVVTDTAPLLVSGETEYLARFVDSAIVVIESGVTTKAQLLEVARTLERLDIAAVGFVLNRISLSKANPAFRQSVRAVEKHLKAQSRAFDRARQRGRSPEDVPVDTPPSTFAREAAPQPPMPPTPAPGRGVKRHRAAEVAAVPQAAAGAEAGEAIRRPGNQAEAIAEESARPEPVEQEWREKTHAPEWRDSNPPADETIMHQREPVEPVEAREAEVPAMRVPENDPRLPEYLRRPEDRPEVEEPSKGRPTDFLRGPGDAAQADDVANADSAAYLRHPGERPLAEDTLIGESAGYLRSREEKPLAGDTVNLDTANYLRGPGETPVVQYAGNADTTDYARRPEDGIGPEADTHDDPAEYLRRYADELQIQVGTANPARESGNSGPLPGSARDTTPRSETAPSTPAVPPRAPRGRESVRPVGARPPAPNSEQIADVPRAATDTDSRAPSASQAAEAAAWTPAAWPVEDVPARRASPFAEFNEVSQQPPLKEWWQELEPAAKAGAGAEPSAAPAEEAQAAPAPPPDPVDESLARAASRLGGLRNLLVTLGIQNLHQGAEQRKAEQQGEPRVPERAVYAQPVEPNGDDPNGAEVTARPEIIPPRVTAETAERDKEPKAPKPAVKPPHINRWDSPEDVEILPSRRGQYRRRH